MKISIDSLNQYLEKKLTTERVVELLLQTEVEIEEVLPANSWHELIVVAKVEEVRQHPDADRLRLATVNTGAEKVEVVCGAPNLAKDQVVVLAQVGSILPDGLEIKASKLRGVVSHGMLCSAHELGISDDHSGILVLPEDSRVGATLCDIWQKGDCLDIKTPANRWDYLSLIGLAREVAARDEGNKLVSPKVADLDYKNIETAKVKESGECKRFVSVKIRVDNSVKSPQWLVDNLEGNGIRSISPVVDITNYVMIETGQPSHTYDAKKVQGSLHVRLASPAEKLTTLDGTMRTLSEDDLVIADDSGAIGLAGVMGGAGTEVDESTTEIILEVANFDRTRVRKAALRHGIRTEASARFERSLPLPLPLFATERLVQLMREVAQGEVIDSPADQLYGWPWVQHVGLRLRKAEKLLGIKLDEKQVVGGLKRLGFEIEHFSLSKEAQKHLGKPYLWGANFRQNGEDAFDCSYLIDRIYSKIGKMVGHTAQQQYDAGTPVEVGDLRPGDVVFYSGHWEKLDPNERGGVGHNGLYIGGNQVLEAVQYKYNNKTKNYEAIDESGVRISPLSDFTNNPTYLGARRYVDSLNHIFAIVAPWWRMDIRSEEDIVEEIVKIVGYDAIPAELPTLPATNTRPHQLIPRLHELRKTMVATGLQEIVTYSFISEQMIERLGFAAKGHLEIANPLSREQQYLRTTMLPSHLEMARTNQRYKKQFGAFEVARVYAPTTDGELPQEAWKLAITMVGPDSALRLKAVLDRLSQYAKVSLDVTPAEDPNYAAGRFVSITMADELLGGYGQLSKRVLSSFGVQAEVSFAEISITSVLSQTKQALVADLPEYQIIKRDISIVCQNKVVWSDIRQKVLNSAQVSSVEYVGYYQDETLQNVGKKNITLRVGFDLGANPGGDEITKALEGVHLGLQSGNLGEVTIN